MSKKIIEECVLLSDEILKNIELSEIDFSKIVLKCLRLCRLLNEEEGVMLFTYESSGYPVNADNHLTQDSVKMANISARKIYTKKIDNKTKKETIKTSFGILTIGEMESRIETYKIALAASQDAALSISSANPSQYVQSPGRNIYARKNYVDGITTLQGRLEKTKGAIYNYILKINIKLKFGDVISNIFNKNKKFVDDKLIEICPQAIEKLTSAYNNLESTNSEDWSNAVHSCRRVLKEVADSLYPPQDEKVDNNGTKILVGNSNIINRLVLYFEGKSLSQTYSDVITSNLRYFGERLDSLYNALNKGTHDNLNQRDAERFVIYTYILLEDVLSV